MYSYSWDSIKGLKAPAAKLETPHPVANAERGLSAGASDSVSRWTQEWTAGNRRSPALERAFLLAHSPQHMSHGPGCHSARAVVPSGIEYCLHDIPVPQGQVAFSGGAFQEEL